MAVTADGDRSMAVTTYRSDKFLIYSAGVRKWPVAVQTLAQCRRRLPDESRLAFGSKGLPSLTHRRQSALHAAPEGADEADQAVCVSCGAGSVHLEPCAFLRAAGTVSGAKG